MAVPVLKLDLAPPSNLWRMNHPLIGWGALIAGSLILAGTLAFTWNAYKAAAKAGHEAVMLAGKARSTSLAQQKVLAELRNVDVAKELPRWRLAERIFTERSLPWSRLTAELERSLTQDVRIKSLQRTRNAEQKVQLKIKGEAKTRDTESAFMVSLQKNAFFDQVILEREGERQGGGVDFDYTLLVNSAPPAYAALPKFGPARTAPVAAAPAKPVARPLPMPSAKPAPIVARPPAPVAQPTPVVVPDRVWLTPDQRKGPPPRVRRPNRQGEDAQ